jgi:hypothetical protein
MVLTLPRMYSLLAISTVALVAGSCGSTEYGSPTGPTMVASQATAGPAGSAVLSPADEGDAPINGDDPAPPPDGAPPAADPAPAPGPDPAPAPPAAGPAPAPDPNAPWNPGPPPTPAPPAPGQLPTPMPGTPNSHPRLIVKIEPEPVPYSGKPVPTFSCRDLQHTWYYEQILHGQTGIAVTITERENFFDGRFVSKVSETIHIPGNGTHRLQTRWCSGYPKFHYAQTRFTGKDENGEPVVINGPWVRLMAP